MPDIVAVLALDMLPMFEAAVATEVWGVDRSDAGVPPFEFRMCGMTADPVVTTSGFSIVPSHDIEGLRNADLVVVPGWHPAHDDPVPADISTAVNEAFDAGARIASFCAGVFVLAAAGLLDGRRATSHWMHADRLTLMYPEIAVDRDVLYVDEDPLFTSAGTAAAIDLCLHITRKDHGSVVANRIARRMVVPPHRDGGQAQFVESPVNAVDDDPIGVATTWALRRLQHDITVEDLARRAKLSPRTFARRFRAAAGTTPLQWLLVQRVREAQRLLESTALSVDEIASRCGLGTAANLRIHFARVVGTTPTSYRATFRRTA
jgi:AraC family transcriptional regulator, transcriptional activator FtrA